MACKLQKGFRMCVHPCLRYLTGGDTHILCVFGRGACTVSTAMCFHCGRSNPAWHSFARMLRLTFPRALVPLLPRHSEGCGPGVRKGIIFSAFTWQIQCLVSGLGCTRCGFFRPDRGSDTSAIWFWGIRCCKYQCKVYWGLTTSVSCLWGASWGCDKTGWEIKYRLASREGGCSFKKQTWGTLLAVSRTTSMPGIDFCGKGLFSGWSGCRMFTHHVTVASLPGWFISRSRWGQGYWSGHSLWTALGHRFVSKGHQGNG